MDPPPAEASRRGAAGNGGKGSKTRRLGLKKLAAPAPTPSPTAPAATSTPTAPAPNPIPTAPTCPLQGARWASIPPNFAQDPNSWIYPPGGFLNILQQPLGENFHMVGQNVAYNPISPPHPANSYGTPSPHGTDQAMEEEIPANKKEKRNLRYWTHEEEERLASSWLEISKDPIHGNDKKGDTFWKEITSEFNRKGKGKRTRVIIVKVEEDRKMERDKVTAAQRQISSDNLKAAQENKAAKMFEVYNSLITQDTVNMSEEAKASREKAMRKLEEQLFAD